MTLVQRFSLDVYLLNCCLENLPRPKSKVNLTFEYNPAEAIFCKNYKITFYKKYVLSEYSDGLSRPLTI